MSKYSSRGLLQFAGALAGATTGLATGAQQFADAKIKKETAEELARKNEELQDRRVAGEYRIAEMENKTEETKLRNFRKAEEERNRLARDMQAGEHIFEAEQQDSRLGSAEKLALWENKSREDIAANQVQLAKDLKRMQAAQETKIANIQRRTDLSIAEKDRQMSRIIAEHEIAQRRRQADQSYDVAMEQLKSTGKHADLDRAARLTIHNLKEKGMSDRAITEFIQGKEMFRLEVKAALQAANQKYNHDRSLSAQDSQEAIELQRQSLENKKEIAKEDRAAYVTINKLVDTRVAFHEVDDSGRLHLFDHKGMKMGEETGHPGFANLHTGGTSQSAANQKLALGIVSMLVKVERELDPDNPTPLTPNGKIEKKAMRKRLNTLFFKVTGEHLEGEKLPPGYDQTSSGVIWSSPHPSNDKAEELQQRIGSNNESAKMYADEKVSGAKAFTLAAPGMLNEKPRTESPGTESPVSNDETPMDETIKTPMMPVVQEILKTRPPELPMLPLPQ